MADSHDDDELLFRSASAAFADSDDQVDSVLRVDKISDNTQGSSFSLKQKRTPRGTKGGDSKPRVLCTTVKKDKKSNDLKGRIHVLKKGENGALQVKTTFKLKTLLTIEAYPKWEYGFVLIFDKEKSSDTTFAAGSRQQRRVFLSSLLSLCSTTNAGRIPLVLGLDLEQPPTSPDTNSVAQRSSFDDFVDDAQILKKSTLISSDEIDELEVLASELDLSGRPMDELYGEIQEQLSKVEESTINSILQSEHMVVAVVNELQSALGAVDDMQQWLTVLNLKMQHMRDDIAAIEQRNNALEIQSNNEQLLLKELQALLETIDTPSVLRDFGGIETLSLDDPPSVEKVENVGNELCKWVESLSKLTSSAGLESMRAVIEARVTLNQAREAYIDVVGTKIQSKISAIIEASYKGSKGSGSGSVSLHSFSFKEGMKESNGVQSDKLGRIHGGLGHVEGANRRLHRILYLFMPIVKTLKSLGAELSVDTLKLAYARSINGRLRRQCKDLYSEIKGLVEGQSSRIRANKAFLSQLEEMCPLLVNEGLAFASFFSIDSPLPTSSTDAAKQSLSPSERKVLEKGMERMLENLDEELLLMVDFLCKQQSRKLSIPLLCDISNISEQYGKNWVPDADEDLNEVTLLIRGDQAFNIWFDKVKARILHHNKRLKEECQEKILKGDVKGLSGSRTVGILKAIDIAVSTATSFEESMDDRERRSDDSLDQAFTWLQQAVHDAIEEGAKADPKHADLIKTINLWHLSRSLESSSDSVQQGLRQSELDKKFQASSAKYVWSVIVKYFGPMMEFLNGLKTQLETVSADDIGFQQGYTKQDFRKISRGLSSLERSITTMRKKMEKYLWLTKEDKAMHSSSPRASISDKVIIQRIWSLTSKSFLSYYEELGDLGKRCYRGETLPFPKSEVERMLE